MSTVSPEWAHEALEGVYEGKPLFVQNEERCITIRDGYGLQVAWITWGGWHATIGQLHVCEEFRRLGLATKLLNRARDIEPDLQHATSLSSDAKAWIAALGEQDRCKTPR